MKTQTITTHDLRGKKLSLDHYIIKSRIEWTYCHNCGCDLETGDNVYMSEVTEKTYCSKNCANGAEL